MDVDNIGWVGVGLGGAYGCTCGILYAPMLGVVVYAELVSLTSSSYPSPCSPYSSELIVLGGVFLNIFLYFIVVFFLLNSPHHIVFCLVKDGHNLALGFL